MSISPSTPVPPTIGTGRCAVCGQPTNADDFETFCVACRYTYPASLLKAIVDEFDYALRLRTGEVYRFTSAYITGEYAHLELADWDDDLASQSYAFERGVDVRVADIVWCADAPQGS